MMGSLKKRPLSFDRRSRSVGSLIPGINLAIPGNTLTSAGDIAVIRKRVFLIGTFVVLLAIAGTALTKDRATSRQFLITVQVLDATASESADRTLTVKTCVS